MFVCVAVCSIYTLNRHRRHSCYKDKRWQVGDGDCCKAVMAVIVLKTRTAFICSPSSQRRERKRERGGGELKREREHTDCLRLAFNISMTTHTRLSLTLFSSLVLPSLSICSSAFFSSSSYSRSPLVPSGHKHQHVTHMAMKHNEHTHRDTHQQN